MKARARPVDGRPMYLHVAEELERSLAGRPAGETLASEKELAFSYGVSRLTARAAFAELERRFLVRRSQGRRTQIAHRIDYCVGPDVAPTRTVFAAGHAPRSNTVALRQRRAPEQVCEALRLPKCSEGVYLARQRYVDDELAAYAETWLAADLVPNLAAPLGSGGSLFRALEDVYRLEPVRAASQAEFIVATDALARKLKMDGRPMLFRLDGRTDSARARRPVEVTASWLRADMFRIVFALERQRA